MCIRIGAQVQLYRWERDIDDDKNPSAYYVRMRFSIYVESVLHRCVQRKRSVVHDLDLPQWITSVEGKEEKFFFFEWYFSIVSQN